MLPVHVLLAVSVSYRLAGEWLGGFTLSRPTMSLSGASTLIPEWNMKPRKTYEAWESTLMESRPTSSHGLSQPVRPWKDPEAFPITSSSNNRAEGTIL